MSITSATLWHFVAYFLTPNLAFGIAKGFMLGTLSKSQVRTPNNALPSTANLLVPYALSTIAIATNMSLAILLSEAVVQFK